MWWWLGTGCVVAAICQRRLRMSPILVLPVIPLWPLAVIALLVL